MAARKRGAVVNVSSMAAAQAISGVMGYSLAKAGIDSFTRWMAVDMARHTALPDSPTIRTVQSLNATRRASSARRSELGA